MKRSLVRTLCGTLLAMGFVMAPVISRAQQAQQATTGQVDGLSILGSVVLSILYLPLKLVTCVGTQAGAAVAYTATYGVAGNYDGETNGKQIGEVARRSCTGDWIIPPEQVKKDYQ